MNNWVGDDFRLGLGSPGNDRANNDDIAEDWADLDGDGITSAEKVPFAMNGARRGDDPQAPPAGAPPGDDPFVDMGPYERCQYLTGVVGDANTLPSNRFLAMSVPSFDPANELLAIRVTMVDLQHPKPANLPAQAPPNFTTYDTRLNGVCVGGTLIGHHCDVNADCPGSTCGSLAACTAAGEANGCARWVGKPGTFLEEQDFGVPGGTYRAARLQCTPYYHTWGSIGVFHVTGAEIIPSSIYNIDTFASACQESGEATCQDVSCPVQMRTARSGDVTWNFNPPATTTQPDALDVVAVVNKLKRLVGSPIKVIAQLQPNLVELNADINALDIVAVVDAVRQVKYAFLGPCACPSTVTCGALACPGGPGVCVTAQGAGAQCVKTCTGPGPLAGDPCINTTHCVDSGTCGAGFCRDRCGRCSP